MSAVKNNKENKVIIDVMGGDHAPLEIIKGAIDAKNEYEVNIELVGDKQKIIGLASSQSLDISDFIITDAPDKILFDDSPSDVLKKRKGSSIFKGTEISAGTIGSSFLSAGNTGAVMACSLFNNKRIEGVLRPAIGLVLPVTEKGAVLIDAGANADCKPQYFDQFALMGKIYAQNILGIDSPRVGLANVGSEEKKGSEIIQEAYKLLKNSDKINFIGNIEGRDIFEDKADVIVCDGFVGNIVLKTIEGLASLLFGEIKNILTSGTKQKICALMLRSSFKKMKNKFDYEEYGGAMLLGVNGITIIAHGSSKAKAIKNAVKVALFGMENNLIEKIRNDINT